MKLFLPVVALFFLAHGLNAGESVLVGTYQPLDGLASDHISIDSVTCHGWYYHGPMQRILLISARNVPPTDNPEMATQDINLASVCKLTFSCSDLGAPKPVLEVAVDASKFEVPKTLGYAREDIVRASIECLRLCLPDVLRTTPLTFKASEANKEWIGKIVQEFNTHDRTKVFYTPPS